MNRPGRARAGRRRRRVRGSEGGEPDEQDDDAGDDRDGEAAADAAQGVGGAGEEGARRRGSVRRRPRRGGRRRSTRRWWRGARACGAAGEGQQERGGGDRDPAALRKSPMRLTARESAGGWRPRWCQESGRYGRSRAPRRSGGGWPAVGLLEGGDGLVEQGGHGLPEGLVDAVGGGGASAGRAAARDSCLRRRASLRRATLAVNRSVLNSHPASTVSSSRSAARRARRTKTVWVMSSARAASPPAWRTLDP